jgi:dTDP-4-amino-4,6-dideoxygalactose transaminase
MSAQGEYKMTEMFEEEVAKYTGAPYAVAVDSCSNAIFLSLMWNNVKGMTISIPEKTYVSVPCSIIHAGAKVRFLRGKWTGAYRLLPTNVIDAALRFTHDMYIDGTMMCLSFTGHLKRLKLSKGGMILLDNEDAYNWLIRARSNGRREMPYLQDNFDMVGWNFYMLPELAVRGYMMMRGMYRNGTPLHFSDIEGTYSDLSLHPAFK